MTYINAKEKRKQFALNTDYSQSHYDPSHRSIYVRRTALSKEREYTILGCMMIVFTLVTILCIAYHIFIVVMIEIEANE